MSPSAFRHLQIVSAVLFFLGSFDSAGCAVPRGSTQVAADIVPDHLQVSSMIDPVGVDRKAPPLSWELHATASDARDLRQSSYEILVASSAEELAEAGGIRAEYGLISVCTLLTAASRSPLTTPISGKSEFGTRRGTRRIGARRQNGRRPSCVPRSGRRTGLPPSRMVPLSPRRAKTRATGRQAATRRLAGGRVCSWIRHL